MANTLAYIVVARVDLALIAMVLLMDMLDIFGDATATKAHVLMGDEPPWDVPTATASRATAPADPWGKGQKKAAGGFPQRLLSIVVGQQPIHYIWCQRAR